jgi:hypothetical protein
MNQEIAKAIANGQNGAYVEEMHLWHGSPFAEKICKEGFSLGRARGSGLFGKGKLFFRQQPFHNKCLLKCETDTVLIKNIV